MSDKYTKFSVGKKGVEKVTYQRNPSMSSGGYRGGRSADGMGSSQFFQQNQEQTLRRRNRTIREFVQNNFLDHLCSFVTLTIDPLKFPFSMKLSPDNPRDEQLQKIVETAAAEFRKFICKVKKQYKPCIYLAVPELNITSNKVNIHFHMLINLINWNVREAEHLWGWGQVHTEDVYDTKGISFYMTKWNDLYNENLLFAKKGYFASQGLLRNKMVHSWLEEDMQKYYTLQTELEQLKAASIFETENDFLGKVTYEHYNLEKAQIWDIDEDV